MHEQPANDDDPAGDADREQHHGPHRLPGTDPDPGGDGDRPTYRDARSGCPGTTDPHTPCPCAAAATNNCPDPEPVPDSVADAINRAGYARAHEQLEQQPDPDVARFEQIDLGPDPYTWPAETRRRHGCVDTWCGQFCRFAGSDRDCPHDPVQ